MDKNQQVRVRFAPSPTGGLHLGGVRTVLYNYLFARQNGGTMVLRIEDTDQSRYVEGAEEYISQCLQWCGLDYDEGPDKGGKFGPYRQSERKELYRDYALQLVEQGQAYYAFDTPEELDAMRERLKAAESHSLQYDHHSRMQMRNSLSLSEEETQKLLNSNTPYVIRIKMEPGISVQFDDLIRGTITMDTGVIDDKVLLKADGMPTYHLAVVVDDHLMQISHAFRGEEWLPSAPVHILLWKYLFGLDKMVKWAHLPLILKPDGNGKLSKRDGERLGFPVYPLTWTDPNTGETINGFKEQGFLPQAFINLLSLLGWNDGTTQEIFSLEELIQKFSLDRVHITGARFDYEKAKWFNHEWIKCTDAQELVPLVSPYFEAAGIATTTGKLAASIALVKERCTLLSDFVTHAAYFFEAPKTYDENSVKPKWDGEKSNFYVLLNNNLSQVKDWKLIEIEKCFKETVAASGLKAGELQMILRIFLVGSKTGPAVLEIAEVLGNDETRKRIVAGMEHFNQT